VSTGVGVRVGVQGVGVQVFPGVVVQAFAVLRVVVACCGSGVVVRVLGFQVLEFRCCGSSCCCVTLVSLLFPAASPFPFFSFWSLCSSLAVVG
jgi:hypothetical protein